MLIICGACRGAKKVSTMGMMGTKDCETCSGIGKIKAELTKPTEPIDNVEPIIKKKRNRKPKPEVMESSDDEAKTA